MRGCGRERRSEDRVQEGCAIRWLTNVTDIDGFYALRFARFA